MSNLFLTVLSLSIMGSVVILCVILLNKVFKMNYSKRWLYIIWLVIAIRLIIPVNISIIDTPRSISSNGTVVTNSIKSINSVEVLNSIKPSVNLPEVNNQITADIVELGDDLNTPGMATQEEVLKEKEIKLDSIFLFSAFDIITAIWYIGAFLYLFYHLGAYLIFRRKLYRWSVLYNNKEVLEQFLSLCTELNIKRQINISICNQVKSPILIGFIKPCIVLPLKDFTMEQYYFILKHELIHYKHHDILYKFILLCTATIHWFNPFVHYMVYLANNDIELYCDEKLVEKNNLLYRENYSKLLLQVIADSTKISNLLLSTGLGSKNKQLKKRFFQIMNGKPTKKGTCFIIGLVCLIFLIGNLTSWIIPVKSSNAEMADKQINASSSELENQVNNTSDQLEEISNVLVVGIDGAFNSDNSKADSILVVSVDPDTKKISLISFLRDMYLQIPEHGKNKLSSVYKLGGVNLVKETIETNFDISIDYTVTVNMEAFENIFDSIGGIELELSENEAEYLNKTNYISNKQYRNVTAGKQILNGNQILGYIRVRKVPTIEGENGDIGRTARLRKLLSSIIEEFSRKDISELTKVIIEVIPNVSTNLSMNEMLIYLNTVLQDNLRTDTFSIPADGSYTEKVQDGMSIIDVDLEVNKKVLKDYSIN